jgi:1-pyrroline-5-carboxylate dehydrogenase
VIHEGSFDKLASFIDQAKDTDAEIIVGGNYDKSVGYFVEPTVIVTTNPHYSTMETELFGPVMTILFTKMLNGKRLELLDATSPYALTELFSARIVMQLKLPVKTKMLPVTSISMTNQQVLSWTTTIRWRKSVNKRAGSPLNLLRWVTKNNQRNFCNSSRLQISVLGE